MLRSAQAYASAPTAPHLIELMRATEPPRQELLRRINRTPGGTASIVAMRRALLARLGAEPALAAVEDDFLHLLASWFNPGFLRLQQVDWRSPAQLLEQIIRHEAVHAIDGWDDLRRRLEPDRRCFAFFHPQLPDEPLIFVEVALLPDMPDAIAPLIAKAAVPPPAPSSFKVAAFYSISNCQPGLKGVSLGNFLIKRVAERLKERAAAAAHLLHAVADPRLRRLARRQPRFRRAARGSGAAAPSASPRRRSCCAAPTATTSPAWPAPPRSRPPTRPSARRCCASAPPTCCMPPRCRAATRWRASISTTAPGWNASTSPPTCRRRG